MVAGTVGLEWGPTGGAALAGGADVAVVVDVLSFTTTLTVAVGRGITVLPYPWKDERAAAFAAEQDAVLAVGRLEARSGATGTRTAISLSPAALASRPSLDDVRRLVLPSPNGSTISAALASTGARVVGACLLNASAAAAWLAPQVARGARVAVVPAGERWPDATLRPAVEDLWGAGAVLAALVDLLPHAALSTEARLAERAFRSVATSLATELLGCVSGSELVDAGFGADVDLAARLDSSDVVPVLSDGEFRPFT